MCSNHRLLLENYGFFIHFFPDVSLIHLRIVDKCSTFNTKQSRKFVFVNYSNESFFYQFHGKAITLDIRDRHVPFPSLFIIHENRVRGFQPFQPVTPDMPRDIRWQDWISTGHVFNNTSGSFIRDKPLGNNNDNNIVSAQLQLPIMGTGGASSGGCTLEINQNVIADILVATRAISSWKACQMEDTSWTSTAEENIKKYIYWCR